MAITRTYVGLTIKPEQKTKAQRMANLYFDGNISAAMASLIDAVELPEVPQPVAHLYKPLAKIDRAAEQEKKAKQSTANRKQRAKEILEGK